MRKKIASLLIIFVVAILFLSCEREKGEEVVAPSNKTIKIKEIKVAGIYPLTGKAATFGQWAHNGVELAIDEINAAGGVNGVNLKHIVDDTQTDNKLAVSAFNKAISIHKVDAAVGFVSSGEALACAPVAEQNNTVMITPVAGTEKLKEAGEYVFRTRESGYLQAYKIAEYAIKQLKINRASILYENAANAIAYRDAFKSKFEALGGRIVTELSYDENTGNWRTYLAKLKQLDQAAVYAPGISTVIGLILKQSQEIGFKTQWLSSAGIEDPKLFEMAGGAAEGLIFATSFFSLDSNNQKTKHFVGAYQDKYGSQPSVYAANAYDTIYILAECFNNGAIKGQSLVDCLYGIMDFSGASGTITFDNYGEVYKPTTIKVVKDNRFILAD